MTTPALFDPREPPARGRLAPCPEARPRSPAGRGGVWRGLGRPAAAALAVLALLSTSGPAKAGGEDAAFGREGVYAGLFAGSGRTMGRIVDVDGFANWGVPGSSVEYGHAGFSGGALIGKRFAVGGLPLRFELDGALGDLRGKSNRLDPRGRDESVATEFGWIATARAGFEQALGAATIFASAGLAAARIDNSVSDLDRGLDPEGNPTPWRFDPDDSFRDRSTELGWVIGIGVEAPLAEAWALRLEGSYMDFGRSTHYVNRSGDGRCGPGNPRRPCPYEIGNRLGMMRLGLVYRFGG